MRSPLFRSLSGAALLTLLLTARPSLLQAGKGPEVRVLPNGLTLILEEDHSQPLIAASVCVKGGSRTETAEISGLSHYYEHLIFRGGSKEQGVLEFRQKMQQLGEESGGYTSDDYTNYGFTVPKENFDDAFRRLTDAVLDLNVTEDKIQAERQVVLEEYNQDDDRPDDRVYRQLLGLVYKRHPYRVDPLGAREVIENATLETFRTFYEQRYVPNQMVLSLVGDFQTEAVAETVSRTWGARPAGAGSFERGMVEPEQAGFRWATLKMDTATEKALLAFPVPPAVHADKAALDLAVALLASGRSSRFWQALKIKQDLVLSVSGWVEERVDPGFLAFSLELQPEHLEEALGTMARELAQLRDQPPPVDEINRVREQLLAERQRSLQTPFGRAVALGKSAVLGSAFDLDRYPALLGAVTREDISRVVRTYMTPLRGDLSLVMPKASADFAPASFVSAWGKAWGPTTTTEETAAAPVPVRIRLKNGADLVLQARPQAGMVGVVVLVRGGQWAEPAGKSGLANFTARMLDRGAAGMSQVDLAGKLAALGATLETYGGRDAIGARLEVPGENYRAALDLLADVLTAPTFPADEVEKQRKDILFSIRTLPDRPFEYTNREFYRMLYKQSPYRAPVEGTEASVQSLSEGDLREFHKQNMVGANLVLAVAGPVEAEAVRAWAERRLGVLTQGVTARIGETLDGPPAATLDTLEVRKVEQTTYNTGWLGPKLGDPDDLPLRLAVQALGDRLFFKYVYQKGVAYRSWFYMTHPLGQGSVQNEMGVSPDVYPDTKQEVDQDIAGFAGTPIPAVEVQAARQKQLNQYYLGAQTSIGLASSLASYELGPLGLEGYLRFPERLKEVTPEQASAAAKKYIVPARFIRVGVGMVPQPRVKLP